MFCHFIQISIAKYMESYSGTYIKTWEKLNKYILNKRKVTGLSNYAEHFEVMYNEAKKYRDEN